MTYEEIKYLFDNLPQNYKTKDIDRLNKKLIKEKQDISILKNYVKDNDLYNRTYFQVSLGILNTYVEQYEFIEQNALLLNDWWHTDQLTQFIEVPDIYFAAKKASEYIYAEHPFLRRWGYVMFMPTLVKQQEAFDLITPLFKDDDEYYVQMAQAWLISYLAIYHPEKTLSYLHTQNLKYNIISKAIQKILDSYRISDEYKIKFKEIRKRYY